MSSPLLDFWPRRRPGRDLPPGQRVAKAMPRFSARPHRPPPPAPAAPALRIRGAVAQEVSITLDRLVGLERVDLTADFHCVTTWTVLEVDWSGWRMRDVWERLVVPEARPDPSVSHVRAHSHDGYAPLRLVSPAQYAYKSVKHLSGLTLYTTEPRRFGGRIEHPRARVDREERHAAIGGRWLRWPYRALILPVAWIARRSSRR